jgi:hypothetical protein
LAHGAAGAGSNAVVVFKDRTGRERRYWYFQHAIDGLASTVGEDEPFKAFINKTSFQFMMIKAAQSHLFEGLLGLNAYTIVGRPAKRNQALVIADQRIPHPTVAQYSGVLIDQQPVFKDVPRKHVLVGARYGYGYKIFYAPASALATPFTPPASVIGHAAYVPDVRIENGGDFHEGAAYDVDGVRLMRDGDAYAFKKDGVWLMTQENNKVMMSVRGETTPLSGVSDVHLYQSRQLVLVYYFADGAWREGRFSLADGSFRSQPLNAARVAAGEADAAEMMKGGIDLSGADLNMIIKRDGDGMPLPAVKQDLEKFRIDGLVPEILDVRPAASLPLFQQPS